MLKLTNTIIACLLLHFCTSASIKEINNDSSSADSIRNGTKRDGGITAAIIGAGISAGATLMSTTAQGMMAPYSVAAAGEIENYSKWRMIKQNCKYRKGYMNHPMVNVDPGKKEGFASHKTGNAATGSWVYCLYKVNGKRVHISYSNPYNHNFHGNTLSLAVTSTSISLDASKMYYQNYFYMDRQDYYSEDTPTEICQHGICLKGTMGSSHKAKIFIKLYPQSYDDLSPSITKRIEELEVKNASEDWDKFIDEEFESN